MFEQTHEMAVQLPVHHKNRIPPVGGSLYISILRSFVGSIKEYDVAVFVGLRRRDKLLVFLDSEIFILGIFQEVEFHSRITELLVGKHAVFYENLDVIPLLFEFLTVGFEQFFETRRHFFGDIRRNLLNRRIALQIRARNIQRDVG